MRIRKKVSNGKIEKFGDYFLENLGVTILKGKKKQFLTEYIKIHWSDIVGADIAKNTTIVNILNKELLLYTPISSWAQNLKFYEEDIVSKVNLYAGKNVAKTIRFVSRAPKKLFVKLKSKETFKSDFKLDDLTNREEEEIKNTVSKVEDDELRAVLEHFGRTIKRIQNYRRDNLIKCKICGKYEGKEICDKCRLEKNHEIKMKVWNLLDAVPYYSYAQVANEIPEASPDLVRKVRVEMVQKLAKKINAKDTNNFQVKFLAMLYKGVTPEFLTEDMIKDTLKRLRFDLLAPPEPDKKYKSNIVIKRK